MNDYEKQLMAARFGLMVWRLAKIFIVGVIIVVILILLVGS